MQPGRVTGPGAGVRKYDILTAVAIAGLHGTTTQQVSALRLLALITARYNWQRNELSIGQEDMARLWGVNTRTAKREVKRLIAAGLLEVRRAGVRGRVASYRLNLAVVENLSRPVWGAVGRDFEERAAHVLSQTTMRAGNGNVLKVDFPGPTSGSEPEGQGGDSRWQAVMNRLAEDQPEAFANWYRRLSLGHVERDGVQVCAPNAFVSSYVATHLVAALADAVEDAFGTRRVDLTARG